MCTNAASRARDGDPRFAPVALAGYTAADTPDPRVSLLRATSREPIAFLWSAPPREPVISCAITCLVDQRWENPYDQRIRLQIQHSIRF